MKYNSLLENFIELIKDLKKENIILTKHAEIRSIQRKINKYIVSIKKENDRKKIKLIIISIMMIKSFYKKYFNNMKYKQNISCKKYKS